MTTMGIQLLVGLLLMLVALLVASASIARSIRRDDTAIADGDVELRALRAARRARDAARDAKARLQAAKSAQSEVAQFPLTVDTVNGPVVIERRPGGFVMHQVVSERTPAKGVGASPVANTVVLDLSLSARGTAQVPSQAATVATEAERRAQLEELE